MRVTVNARKVRAGPLGDETMEPIDDLVEIGVYGRDEDEPIYLRKERFRGEERTFRIVLDERPLRAGIDPLHKLIDRDLDDNVVDVTRRAGTPVRPRADSAARRPSRDTARDSAR